MNSIKTGILASVIGIVAVAAPSFASAATLSWDRSATGQYGAAVTASGSCTTGSGCERAKTGTGVNGNWTRSTSSSYSGEGTYTRTVSLTGPNASFTRSIY